jgi:Na+/proline symporter
MISLWSWIVILLLVVFFGLTQIAGYIGAKRTKRGLYEFYVAGGVLATITVICTYAATYMEAYELVGMPAVIVSWGLQYWMTSMAGYCGLVFLFYTVSIRLYRLGKLHKYITPTDLIVHRVGGFERPLRILVAIMIIYATIIYVGMVYIPAAGVLSAATGGEIPYHLFLLLYVLFIVIYVSAGGMRAVAYADIMATTCFLPAFIALIYVILTRWGGFINLLWGAYTSEIAPTIYQATLPVQYFLSAILVFGGSWTFIPHLVVRLFAAKRVKSVLQGGLVAYTIFFICGCLWPLIASSAIAAYYGSNLPQITVVEEYVCRLVRDFFLVKDLY